MCVACGGFHDGGYSLWSSFSCDDVNVWFGLCLIDNRYGNEFQMNVYVDYILHRDILYYLDSEKTSRTLLVFLFDYFSIFS